MQSDFEPPMRLLTPWYVWGFFTRHEPRGGRIPSTPPWSL